MLRGRLRGVALPRPLSPGYHARSLPAATPTRPIPTCFLSTRLLRTRLRSTRRPGDEHLSPGDRPAGAVSLGCLLEQFPEVGLDSLPRLPLQRRFERPERPLVAP